jgi:IS5 family transposase
MPPATARANARKSSVRCAVEHVFAQQKGRCGRLARAEAKLTVADLTHNFDRLIFHERRAALG